MINNENQQFNGNIQYTQINIVVNNFISAKQVPETLQPKISKRLSVREYVSKFYALIKWVWKFILIFISMNSS